MEKHQHPFDEFLKETLKGHQLVPREEARKAFLDEARTIHPARRGWPGWYYLPLLVVVVVSGIIILFSYLSQETEVPAIATGNQIPRVEQSTSSSVEDQPSTVINTEIASPVSDTYFENQTQKAKNPNTGTQSAGNPSSSTPLPAEAEKVSTIQGKAENAPVVTDAAEGKTEGMTAPEKQVEKDTSVTIPPAKEPKSFEPDQAVPELAFAASAFYLPEYMFNTVEGGKYVSNFGFDFTFYRGRTSIRTGAGISISEGVTEKAVEYNEFLGTYNKLDSISFIFNESAGDFYPTIHTSSENVWDSLSLYDSTEIIKRYTYLQIPLILGFDFWQKNSLTVGVRIGTIMSVMLNSKQLTGAYEAGANQVVGISALSPDQVSMNWQAVGGINGSLLLTRRLYLEIEPQAKYYYQSIYEKSGYDKKPWSLGLRMAILYKF